MSQIVMVPREKRPFRVNALSAGILFIVADLASFLSLPFMAPVNSSNYLVDISANTGLVATAAILIFIGGVAAIGISVSLYPALKQHDASLALGATSFRTVEGVLDFIAVAMLLTLITLSQKFVGAGIPDASYYESLGSIMLSGHHWVINVCKLMAFSIGAMLYYVVFYRTRMVPRWLSGWGIVAVIMTIISAVLVMYEAVAPFSLGQIVLNLPILFQEMVLAVWLIMKGLDVPSGKATSSKVVDVQ